jgi:hypothetical protein
MATIYADNNGTALNNPFIAGANGYWAFYADDGTYDVRLSGGGLPDAQALPSVSTNDPFFQQRGLGTVTRTKTSKLGDNYSVLDYGAKGDGVSNDTPAIVAALAACTAGHTVTIPSTVSNTFLIFGSISVPAGCTLQGQGGGLGSGAQFNSPIPGTTLKWEGPMGTAMVLFHDVAHSALDGVNLDCNNVAGCINLLYDSDNSPASSFNTFRNITFKGFHQAFVAGNPANTAVASNVCINNENQPGCTEADFFTLDNWNTYGNPNDTSAEAVHINSANAAQGSTIEHFNIQGVNIGIHIVQTNGALRIQAGNGIGSVTGSNATFVQVDSAAVSPDLWQLETEGGQAYAVHDSACNVYGGANPTWFADAWFGNPGTQVLIDGCDNVTDIDHSSNIPLNVSGGASSPAPSVLAINQRGTLWAASGSGKLYHWDAGLLSTNNLTVGGTWGSNIVGSLFAGGWTSPGASLVNVDANATIPAATTAEFDDFTSNPQTTAASFTLNNLFHFKSNGFAPGSGSHVNNDYGYYCTGLNANATNSYCFYSTSNALENVMSNLHSGTAGNSDLSGELTFSGVAKASYTFQSPGSSLSHPECSVSPQSNLGTTAYWVTYTTSPATFTINTGAAVTGTFSYVCVGRQ